MVRMLVLCPTWDNRRTEMTTTASEVNVQTADDLLRNWQGHRALTRRVIDAFSEDKLFHFSLGGMRPFSEMAWEFIRMAVPIVEGISTGKWVEFNGTKPTTKIKPLGLWDQQTAELNDKFATSPAHRFSEANNAFGQ